MRPSLLPVTLFLLGMLQSAPLWAQGDADPGMRTVLLRDRSVYRGELVESVPNDHITLRLATGEIRRFSWGDLAEEPGIPAGPAPLPALAPPAPIPAADRPLVHIETRDPAVRLLRDGGATTFTGAVGSTFIAGNFTRWDNVCQAPCDQPLVSGDGYRVGGDGIVYSPPFQLPAGATQVTLHVDAGHTRARLGGITLLGLGLGGLGSGIGLLAAGQSASTFGDNNPFFADTRSNGVVLRDVGIGVLVIGVAAAGIGIITLARSGTHVRVDPGSPVAALRLPHGGKLLVSAQGLHF